jgi:predicted transcriptional regulator
MQKVDRHDSQKPSSRVYVMTDDEREAVLKGLEEADRGEFVPDDVVAEADKRHGL